MRVSCSICTDAYEVDSVVLATPCGHIFHNNCVLQWLCTSKSCPQCRSPVTEKKMIRLYFNPITSDNPYISNLEDSIESLKAQMSEKDSRIVQLQLHAKEMEAEVNKSHQAVLNCEDKINRERLKAKDFHVKFAQMQSLQKENERLENEVKTLADVQKVVNGSQKEVEEILRDMSSRVTVQTAESRMTAVATYCSILKRELRRALEDKKQIRTDKEFVQRTLASKTAALNDYKKKAKGLEEQLTNLLQTQKSKSALSSQCGNDSGRFLTPKMTPSSSNSTASGSSVPAMTPISVNFSGKRPKLELVVLDKSVKTVSVSNSPQLSNDIRLSNSAISANGNIEDEDSVCRIGYNGLGGHGRTIFRSDIAKMNMKGTKKRLKKF